MRFSVLFTVVPAFAEVKENMSSEGAEPIGSSPAAFAAHLKAETERWGRVVRQAKMKID